MDNPQPPTDAALLDFVRRPEYRPLKIRELAKALAVAPAAYRIFRQRVKALEQAGALVRMRQNRYAAPDRVATVSGVLRLQPKGYAFVVRSDAEADVLIRSENIGGASDGDLVKAQVLSHSGWEGLPEGRVTEIENRPRHRVLATFVKRGKWTFARPDDGRWGRDIALQGDVPPDLKDGYKIVLEVGGRRAAGGAWQGRLVEVLGDPDDARNDYLKTVAEFALEHEFGAAALEQAAAYDQADIAPQPQRRDLRPWTCFTIDPEEARDFDDALSVEALPQGGLRLGVHIADVSHFVAADSPLDEEARRRGTSVYLLDRVVPMLPFELSSHLCTLAPGQERLTVSVVLDIDAAGQVKGQQIFPSLIRSAARLTYQGVQAALDGDQDAPAEAVALAEQLVLLEEGTARLHARRVKEGALDLDLPEAMVELDDQGQPLRLGRYPRLQAHRLVEECMLAANRCVGKFLADQGAMALYRVHAPPDAEKLWQFLRYVRSRGVKTPRGPRLTPTDLQQILAAVEGRDDTQVIHMLLLRAMMRAEYARSDIGHFGLACQHYLHFTSPIRRYPDLVVHRILKEVLDGAWDEGRALYWQGRLDLWGRQASAAERRAQEAERAYTKTKQLRFMTERLGEVFEGRIAGFANGGFFVQLDDWMVEGYCALGDLDDYYEWDADGQRLVGRRSGHALGLGDRARVVCQRVDLDRRYLDLRWLEGEDADGRAAAGKTRRIRRRKGAAKGPQKTGRGKPRRASGRRRR